MPLPFWRKRGGDPRVTHHKMMSMDSPTADTYEKEVDLGRDTGLSIEFLKTAGVDTATFKVFGHMQAPDKATPVFVDITEHGFVCINQADAASYTTSATLVIVVPAKFTAVKAQIIVAGGNDDSVWEVNMWTWRAGG